jgi:hypothetical protein
MEILIALISFAEKTGFTKKKIARKILRTFTGIIKHKTKVRGEKVSFCIHTAMLLSKNR